MIRPDARMDADQQEHRPEDQQQQEPDLEHQQRDRHQEDQHPGDQGGDQRADRDAEPARPVLALEEEVDRGCSAACRRSPSVLRLVGAGAGRLGWPSSRSRRSPGAPASWRRSRAPSAALGSAVPNSPISHGLQTRVDQSASAFWSTPGVPLWPYPPALTSGLVSPWRRQAGGPARAGQPGEGGVDDLAGLVGDDLAESGEVAGAAEEPGRHRDREHHPDDALGGRGGPLADQAVPGQPDGAEDHDRPQERPVHGVGQVRITMSSTTSLIDCSGPSVAAAW